MQMMKTSCIKYRSPKLSFNKRVLSTELFSLFIEGKPFKNIILPIPISKAMPMNERMIFFNVAVFFSLAASHELNAKAAIRRKQKMLNNLNKAGCLKLFINGSV